MKLSWFGRLALALFASLALGLGMTACGGYTVAYLWVLGQVSGSQNGEIAAFKVDSYTGNLTRVPKEPFSSAGSTPVSIVVRTGGRFVYVLDQGTYDPSTNTQSGDGIVEFSVGGDGTLNYEQTYHSPGLVPLWLQLDSAGNYLYVLNKYSPSGDGNGSISAFSIDPTTGRLQLIANEQSIPPGESPPSYWEVGPSPLMMMSTGTCMFVANAPPAPAGQSITPFGFGGNGQLTIETTAGSGGSIATNAQSISSITGNSGYVILTDSAANTIIPYTAGSGCSLNILQGGVQPNIAGTSNPTYSLIAGGGSVKYLYVLNQSTTSTTPGVPFSSISGFEIQSTGLSPIPAGSLFPVDSGPVCMVEDPSNLYMYISDRTAGQVTGKAFDSTTGELSDLKRGSTFSAADEASCLAISGAVD